MAKYIKYAPNHVNKPLLKDEIVALSLPITDHELRGFRREGDIYYRTPRRRVIKSNVQGGIAVKEIAYPGEIFIFTSTELTQIQEDALDAALEAHDHTQLTADQQTDVDQAATLAAEKEAVLNSLKLSNFNALSNTDKALALRKAIIFVAKGVRAGRDLGPDD